MFKYFCILLVGMAFSFSFAVEPLTITIDQIDTTKVDAIYLSVSVTDANKEGVSDLDSSNFQIFLGETQQTLSKQVENFYRSEKGVAVIVCIDASLTMQGKPLEDSKNAVKEYLDHLRSQDRVAILSFHSKVELVSDFSMNRQYLKEKIDGITAGGTNTELYYAVDEALDHLNQTPNIPERKLVILISDGRDEGTGAYNLEQCVQKAKQSRIPIFSVGFTKIDEKYLKNLEALSERTKGQYYRARESSVIRDGFNKSLEVLKSQYAIRIQPPKAVRDGKPRLYTIKAQKPNFIGQTTFQYTMQPTTLTDTEEEKEAPKIPLLYWIIIAGTVVVIGVVIFFVIRAQRKKREQELAQAREREEATKRQIEEAQRREEELRKKLEEKEKEKQPQQPSQSSQGVVYGQPNVARTMVDPSAQAQKSSSTARNKTMVGSSLSDGYSSGELVIISGNNSGQSFSITRPETTIGRGMQNTIVLQDPAVSTNHATLRFANGQFQLSDNQSTNGTYVNGIRIQITILKDGDRIQMGQTELQFKGK